MAKTSALPAVCLAPKSSKAHKSSPITRLLQKSTVSQSCLQDCPDFAERMKRKALRVRCEGSIPPYVTEAESRKQHSDSPLCNSHIMTKGSSLTREVRTFLFHQELEAVPHRDRGVCVSKIPLSSLHQIDTYAQTRLYTPTISRYILKSSP